ncbi:MAG: HAD family hydrolase [Promethearchaeota archaeon]
MIEAVLFDFGGTLFDYEPTNYFILGSVAREFGMDIKDTDPILSLAFQKQEEFVHTLFLKQTEFKPGWMTDEDWRRGDEILLETLDLHSQEAKDALAQRFLARDYYCYTLFPDAYSTLDSFKKAGVKLGIVSNLGEKSVPARYKMLEEHNLTHFFSSIVLSGERGVSKPNPKIFSIALEELEISNPQNVYHVGDSYIFDVIGARDSGINPILIDANKGRTHDCWVIGSLSETLTLLE